MAAVSGSEDPQLCEHAQPGAWPWATRLVLDAPLGIADAVVACGECAQHVLVELIDRRGKLKVQRVSLLSAAEAAGVTRDLQRGSCDLGRADAELAYLRSRAVLTDTLVCVDDAGPRIVARVRMARADIPRAPWRELPCDGQWVDYALSNTEIVNG